MNTDEYLSVIENIKSEITAAQYRAAVHVNTDIRIAFPESKGYSVRKSPLRYTFIRYGLITAIKSPFSCKYVRTGR